ncbi:hypothetical protein BV898_06251 [Hypsibius exemplaris]|uniref:RING-type domain-containing protein n=1 Tax=Hypsibius exemplaris TaxID=2072580 RepID=A0A1W0WWX7_HYPEX|nr:hypothetical protein BV898_06251 [Hypsibius exemplaris]
MNREDWDESPPEMDGWLSKAAIVAMALAAGAVFALWAKCRSKEKAQQPPRQTQPMRGLKTAPGAHTTNQTATEQDKLLPEIQKARRGPAEEVYENSMELTGTEKHKKHLRTTKNLPGIIEVTVDLAPMARQATANPAHQESNASEAAEGNNIGTLPEKVCAAKMNQGDWFKPPPPWRCSGEDGFEGCAAVWTEQIKTKTHKRNLLTARNLPGITAVKGTSHGSFIRTIYRVRGLSEAAVVDAIRMIESRVVSETVRFPENFFQGSPEDRQLTLKLHVESSHVVLTFSEDTESTDVLIGVEGVASNVEQARAMLLRLETDFNYAESARRDEMAQRDAAARARQGSNASEGVVVVAAKASLPPQEMANECIICVDMSADTAFVPCGHKTFCEPCAQEIFQGKGECPTCRGRITAILRLFG